ncbi:MAG: hypothetical protein HY687_03105 [Chloroflexi bacterium]|nr:hypothetical protein [Chloroflexota bacterium]
MALGRTIGNLHSLELLLRVFLHHMDKSRYGTPPPEVHLDKIKVGDVVHEIYFTNYDSLGDLVNKYNTVISQKAQALCVDGVVVKLRDALAHGRVLSRQPGPPFQLYKFQKPSNGQVVVEDVADLNENELNRYIHLTFKEAKKVEAACRRFCPNAFG